MYRAGARRRYRAIHVRALYDGAPALPGQMRRMRDARWAFYTVPRLWFKKMHFLLGTLAVGASRYAGVASGHNSLDVGV